MFMVKDEYANMKNLFRVRVKSYTATFIWFFVVITFVFLASLTGTVVGILRSDTVRYYNITDFSGWMIFGLALGYVLQAFIYRNTNAKLSVYPQTNNSRFISSLLYNYIWVFIAALTVLVAYLLQYGVLSMLSVFVDNIHFALNFDMGFVVAGYFAYVLYVLLLVAVIELIAVILRKWTYYALAAFTAISSLLIVNFSMVIERAPNTLAFLFREASLSVFFVKSIVLLLVITAVAIVINHYTVYHKKQDRALNKSIVIGCVLIALAAVIIVPFALLNTTTATLQTQTISTEVNAPWDTIWDRFEKIRIDISHLPQGSNIEIQVDNPNTIIIKDLATHFGRDTAAIISGTGALENIQGYTLYILYRPPTFLIDDIELFQFANPQFSVRLEGSSLIVDYYFDNAQVIIMPIWDVIRQFDVFRDRNIFAGRPFGHSGGGNMTANINIWIE